MKTISVVTVSFNAASTIRDTIESVLAQDYGEVEYIVVDGESEDGTLDIVNEYRERIDTIISEPDRGIYDAMQKGIDVAKGDVVAFINSDDFYANEGVISEVMSSFQDPGIGIVFGDLCYVARVNTDSVVRYWKSSSFKPGSFVNGRCPPHPTFVVRRAVLQELGGFDSNYQIAADFELMLRLLEVHKVPSAYIPDVLVKMRLGGATNRSLKNIIHQNREIVAALRQHGFRPSWARFIISKIWSRGRQFIRRPVA